MSEDARHDAARYRADRDARDANDRTDKAPRPPRRPEDHALWVDHQVRAAMERGEFDDLPLAGKPLPHIDTARDPDWWLRQFIEREHITGVLPEALQLRKDDAALRDDLDRLRSPGAVHDAVESFNQRVVAARRQLQGGPPVVTALRDTAVEVAAWRDRRAKRSHEETTGAAPRAPRRWWSRGSQRRM